MRNTGSIFVIDPAGNRHGPFKDRDQALEFGKDRWPEAICGNRDEDPGCWEVRISTRDQPTAPPEAA